MIFEPINTTLPALFAYQHLMKLCFPHIKKFTTQYLSWLYLDNPDGEVIGFNAWDGEHLAAHYACIPTQIQLNGESTKAILSLNTATHPAYQGRGLFTKLANMTYEAASIKGYHAVYGVANANSSHGFLNKLGFQRVQALEARLGFGSLTKTVDDNSENNLQFKRLWVPNTLSWRCASPHQPLFRRYQDNKLIFHTPAARKISVFSEHVAEEFPALEEGVLDSRLHALKLFIGLLPQGSGSFRNYYTIPSRLRPSPLNFIYRSLDDKIQKLENGCVSFSFMDFDAY